MKTRLVQEAIEKCALIHVCKELATKIACFAHLLHVLYILENTHN